MIALQVNGQRHQIDAPSNMPLLWALRDIIGLTGTKYGCGIALCGACTVHLDGEPVRSCVLPISEAEGKEVTTIEGISGSGPEALRQAWKELNVPQCGYCQAGQVMTAAALLRRNPEPDEEEIEQAMAGNICRCGTYPRIKAAVQRAAEMGGGEASR